MTNPGAPAADPSRGGHSITRRSLIKGAAGALAAAAVASSTGRGRAAAETPRRTSPPRAQRLFSELDDHIRSLMDTYAVPGVAVAVTLDGQRHVRGFGVTSVDAPERVDANTVFRIGSTTKTFTGTTIMRLVEAGQLDLDQRVRAYLPDFATSDPSVAEQVTLRQVLNHSPGWMGDDYQDFGPGDDALGRYVTSMAALPQMTPLGSTFFYNNAAIALAGRIIEQVTGATYEQAVQEQLLAPLDLTNTSYSVDDLVGLKIAGSHKVVDGKAVLDRPFWYFPRTLNATGGLISSARDQLRYLAFHLGDGTARDGTRLLSSRSLDEMRSHPGPGGTLFVDLDGMGVTFQLRPTEEGVRVVQHGGDWPGQHSGFLFVPDRNFGLTMLTNSEDGPKLLAEFFMKDWALSQFADLHNVSAPVRHLAGDELRAYEGRYTADAIESDGTTVTTKLHLSANAGQLRMRNLGPDEAPLDPPPGAPASLRFYKDDYVVVLDLDGKPVGPRADFVRDAAGNVAWLRNGGRLNRKVA